MLEPEAFNLGCGLQRTLTTAWPLIEILVSWRFTFERVNDS